jgi:hypothetical protein
MSSQLSKLHIRYIQTQENFFLTTEDKSKGEKIPLNQLYIKNSGSFYFVNLGDALQDGQQVTLLFKEANDYLKSLRCTVTAHDIQRSGEEYDDALLFFHIEPNKVKQLLLLSVDTTSDD